MTLAIRSISRAQSAVSRFTLFALTASALLLLSACGGGNPSATENQPLTWDSGTWDNTNWT
jgi:hypothetical protein